MARAISSGWTCPACNIRRIRTLIVDDATATDPTYAHGFETKCPACGHKELVVPSEPGEWVIGVRYSVT